jgi:hypothetical protein
MMVGTAGRAGEVLGSLIGSVKGAAVGGRDCEEGGGSNEFSW